MTRQYIIGIILAISFFLMNIARSNGQVGVTRYTFGQDSLDPMFNQDIHLRACIDLIDTVPVNCNYCKNSQNIAYKFKINGLTMGQCSSNNIIICVSKEGFRYERNRWGGNQKTFFWVLYKDENLCDSLPVYVKGGNF